MAGEQYEFGIPTTEIMILTRRHEQEPGHGQGGGGQKEAQAAGKWTAR